MRCLPDSNLVPLRHALPLPVRCAAAPLAAQEAAGRLLAVDQSLLLQLRVWRVLGAVQVHAPGQLAAAACVAAAAGPARQLLQTLGRGPGWLRPQGHLGHRSKA
jgi:hypothetical protein